MELLFPASPLLRQFLFVSLKFHVQRSKFHVFHLRLETWNLEHYDAMIHFQTYHPTRSWLCLVQHIVPTPPYARSRDVVRDLHSMRWKTDDTRRAGWHSSNENQWGRSPWHARSFPCDGRGANIPAEHRSREMRRMVACWYKPHPHKNGCWVLCDTHHHRHIVPWLCDPCYLSRSTRDIHRLPYQIARTSHWQ